MDRRTLLSSVAFGLCAALLAANALPAGKIPQIGYLSSGSTNARLDEAFRQGLRELGWVEGQNMVIEHRFAEGRFDRLPELAAELVRLKVDILVAQPTPAAVAARNATTTIPIVMINVGDPVGVGLVASLARPGGNVTGTAFGVGLETFGKGLELLKEAIPNIRRVAVLSNPVNPAQAHMIRNLKVAAESLGLRLLFREPRDRDQFDSVFADIARERVDALFVAADSLFILHRTALADLALKYRLPAMYGVRENVQVGGLMSYGPNLFHSSQRAAAFADKILKGAKPADLPVEQPTKFELVVNLRAAKALGLTIPQSLLLRADEVIQ
jgi:putative tryptophan/tyrosine transport system substrate-binding protein